MLNDTFSNRLQKALDMNNMKPSTLAEKTKIDKSLISNYLSGNYKAKQDKLSLLAEALNVSETWLMGYDVPVEDNDELSEIDQLLFSKAKDLSDEDKIVVMNVIDSIKRNIDNEDK